MANSTGPNEAVPLPLSGSALFTQTYLVQLLEFYDKAVSSKKAIRKEHPCSFF